MSEQARLAPAPVSAALAMNRFSKVFFGSILIIAIGLAIYQARQASVLRANLETLEQTAHRKSETVPPPTSAALSAKVQTLEAEHEELTRALAKAHAENARLVNEREQAARSLSLYKQLAAQANAQDANITNQYPSPRYVWAGFGKMGRLMALSKQPEDSLSADDKAALETAKTKALEELPALIRAAKQLDAANPGGPDSAPNDMSDNLACLLYGALNLDADQFGQVYGLVQNYQDQAKLKGLFQSNGAPGDPVAMAQMIEQFKTDMQGMLTPDQTAIFGEVMKQVKLDGRNLSFNFNF
jgi:hypothetical protein